MVDVNGLITQVLNNAALKGVPMSRRQAIGHLCAHAKQLIREGAVPSDTTEGQLIAALNEAYKNA